MVSVCLAGAAASHGAEAAADTSGLWVGEIRLEMDDIFTAEEVSEASGPNRFIRRTMNALHVKTRPWVVSKELLFETGERFRPYLLAESERNLRGLGFLNNVAVVPTDTTPAGRVNVDVRTRETWTLGAEVSFALASDGDSRWKASLSDKNFLGYGFEVRGALGQDLDATYGRMSLSMNRMLHTPLAVRLNLDQRSDGHHRWFQVALPVRSDDQAWSAAFRAWDDRYDTRWYLSNAGPVGADPGREARLYALLPRERIGMRIDLLRRVSDRDRGRVWRVGAGVRLADREYGLAGSSHLLSDGRAVDLSYLGTGGETLARDSGTEVWPYLAVASNGRDWVETRFLTRYGNQEDIPLSPSFALQVGLASPSLGTTSGRGTRLIAEGELRNWSRWGRTFFLQQLDGRVVYGERADRKHRLDAVLGAFVRIGAASHPLTLRTFVEGVHSEGLRGDEVPVLGLDRGLRTLGLDGMAGEKLLRWSAEIGRGFGWVPLDLVRLGWGVFYSGGLAAWSDEPRDLADARHEAGVGLRLGFTRSGTTPLARVDLARDLSRGEGWVITTVTGGYF